MSIHPPIDQQFSISAMRQEVMFNDGTAIVLHPVFDRGVPCQHHRAIRLAKGMVMAVDLRKMLPKIGPDISLAAPRDVPGIVFYTLRHNFTTAELFTRAAIAAGSMLVEPQRVAA